MKTLTIRLTSPLQSYGGQAQFGRRTSGDYPSKSAVIGMLAAALGYSRDDQKIRKLNDLLFAVRVDQPGTMMTEFQTVEWKANTRKLTYRDFLQDAVFVAAIGGTNNAEIDHLAAALRRPKFQLYLGRRANVPAGILKIELFENQSPVDVLETLPWQASRWYQKTRNKKETVAVELIADHQLLGDRPVELTKDAVRTFDQRGRQFEFRPVSQQRINLTNPAYEGNTGDTSQDIFNYL